MKFFANTITTSIAAGASASTQVDCGKDSAGLYVRRIAVAARTSSDAEVSRRLLHLQGKSGSHIWPREGYANAELVTGTGLESSDQATIEAIPIDSGGKVTITVLNKTVGTTIAECDVSVWVG